MESDLKKKIILAVIWSTIEDNVPLFEVPWEINSVYESHQSKKIAQKILIHFLDNGLVEFLWGADNNPLKINDNKTIKELLDNEKYWKSSENGNQIIKVSATEKGKDFYNELYDKNDVNSIYPEEIE